MKIALLTLAGLAIVVLIVAGIGYTLPVKHSATRERTYAAAPSAVFATITTPADFPKWRRGLKRVEQLPEENGKRMFREIGGDGEIAFRIEESVSDRRLVLRIADKSLPFGGSWTYELTPAADGTTLRITEDGEVYNPLFRFMSRFVFGHHRTIENYLADLEKGLGG
jgi:uncharacterized protein YndB with AHSA1/START domain